MRMWMVNPNIMCRQHLLGEHLELHMFLGTIKKGTSIEGYLKNGLLETHNIQSRHDQLVQEMIKRGYKHNTPLDCSYNNIVHINIEHNIEVLKSRCTRCCERIEEVRKMIYGT